MDIVCHTFPSECLPTVDKIPVPNTDNIIPDNESFNYYKDDGSTKYLVKRKEMVWKHSTVGTKRGTKTVKNVRSSYYTRSDKGITFQQDPYSSKFNDKTISYDERMDHCEAVEKINQNIPGKINDMLKHMSHIYSEHVVNSFSFLEKNEYYDFGKGYDDLRCPNTYYSKTKLDKKLISLFPFITETYGLTLLCYTEGGRFIKHTDTQTKSNHFATTLLFLPTNFTGGDLVITCDTDKVHDPCNLLTKGENMVRLKMSEIKEPVLISFRIELPHEVEMVTSGHRMCYKFIQKLPAGTEYFLNDTVTTINLPKSEFIQNILEETNKHKITELKKQIEMLEKEINDIMDSPTKPRNDDDDLIKETFEKIDESTYNDHLIVFPAKINKDGIDLNNTEDMVDFSKSELDFIYQLFDKYPCATISIKNGYRERFDFESDYGCRVICKEDAENMLHGEGYGDIYFNDYNGKSIVYFGDPTYESFGYKKESSTRYNDEAYAGYDYVRVAVIYLSIK